VVFLLRSTIREAVPSVRDSLHGISIGQTKTTPFKYSNFGIARGAQHIKTKRLARESICARTVRVRAVVLMRDVQQCLGHDPTKTKRKWPIVMQTVSGSGKIARDLLSAPATPFDFGTIASKIDMMCKCYLGAALGTRTPAHTPIPNIQHSLQNLMRSSF
jgi:hypothetical protein